MPQEEKLITTGQFASATGTTKDTLFHYDRIGLFRPMYVAANGYRYYSPRQFGVFSDIQNLKRMDMELTDIKEYMDHRSPESFIRLLERQISATRRELHRLTDSLTDMQTALANAREAQSSGEEISVVYYPAVYGIVSRDPEEAFGRRFLDFWTRLQASEMLTYNILCGILPTAHIRQGQFQQYAGIYAQVNGGSPAGAEIARPAGQYLVAYHHGSDHSIGKTYQRMLDYATAHGLQVGEYAFEEYLIYEIAAQQEDQLVTKLLISLSPDSHTPSSLRRRRSALRL